MSVNLEVNINTNNYNDAKVEIKPGAIDQFTRDAFWDGRCQASVKFECMPAAVAPNSILVILSNIEQGIHIVDDVSTIVAVAKLIIPFLKKCVGYEKNIQVSGKWIEITDETTEIELEGKILAILNDQEKKIGKEVSEFMENI